MKFEPVNVVGVIKEQVGSPRNDGTPGSGLYRVPLRLSRHLSSDETTYLTQLWDNPPQFTTMHRPGIARVSGDVLTLDGTTVEEVRDTHARTITVILDKFNQDVPRLLEEEAARRKREQDLEGARRGRIDSVVD